MCEQLEYEPDPVTLDLLEIKFQEHGVQVRSPASMSRDVEALRELELVGFRRTERKRGTAYGLATPLMAKWIRRNVDFESLRRRAVDETER